MRREPGGRRYRLVLGSGLVLLLAIVALPAVSAWAEEGQAEQEVRAVKQRIEALLREAEELQEAGRTEAAEEVRSRARQLKGRLAEYLARRAREQDAQAREKKVRAKKAKARKPKKREDDPRRILAGLEQGIRALRALGGHQEAVAHLQRIAKDLRAGLEEKGKAGERKRKTEVEMSRRHLELLHMAHEVLRGARRGDAADIVEHAVHAQELRMAGRRDEEARRVYESAPGPEDVHHALELAAEILADQGKKDRAKMLIQHMRQAQAAHERAQEERRRAAASAPGKRGDRERLVHEIEVLELAMPVLREEGHERAMAVVERAMHARRLMLSGRKDAEAREIIADQPPPAHVAEILLLAADFWRKYEKPDKAELCAELGGRLAETGGKRRDREQAKREQREREHPDLERLEALQRQLNELAAALRRLQGELEGFARGRER